LADFLYEEGSWVEAAAAYDACAGAADRPDLLLRQAECTIKAGQPAAARELLAGVRRLVPEHPLVAVLEAELALADGDGAQAAAACEQALARDPGCAAAYLLRARVRLRAGTGADALAQACEDLEKACVRDPGLAAARELLVRLQLERERPDEAVAGLQMLAAARPGEHRLKVALARLLLELGRQSALGSQLKTWRDQHPGEPFVWSVEGMLAKAQGDDRGAALAFARHAQATGDPASVLAAVEAFLAVGLPAEARQFCAPFDTAAAPDILLARARLAPPAEARDLLGRAFAAVRDEGTADRVLDQARLVLPPADLLAWLADRRERNPSRALSLTMIRLWEENGRPLAAAELLHALAGEAVGEDRAFLLSRAAAAELAAGEAVRAADSLRQALELVPGHPVLLNNAAHLALAAGGREAEAVRLARQAVAASTANRELHAGSLATMAEALFALRLYDQAGDALQQALAIRETPEELLLLGRTLLAGGKPTQGNAQLRRAKELAEREGKAELARRIAQLL
jgi:predicted Zn-dependent protease